MKLFHLIPISLLICAALFPGGAGAALRMPALFGDHMMLQAGKPATFWGWADPARLDRSR